MTERRANASPGSLVEAVVTLRPLARRKGAPPVPARVQALLDEVQATCGERAADWVVFEGLDAFSLRAPASFVAALSALPAVAGVVANEQPGPGLIEPVSRGPLMQRPDEG